MLDLSNYQGIIFDMDGTLIDSMGGHMKAWQKACENYGYPFDPDYMDSLGGVPTKQTVVLLNEKHQLDHDPSEVATFKRQAWEAMEFVPEAIPAMMDIFHHYRHKVPVGIGTGAERANAEALLNEHKMIDLLGALVTASDVENGKPHPETFLKVAEILQVEASKCVVFEDTMMGVKAANEGGIDCYLVKQGEILDFFSGNQ